MNFNVSASVDVGGALKTASNVTNSAGLALGAIGGLAGAVGSVAGAVSGVLGLLAGLLGGGGGGKGWPLPKFYFRVNIGTSNMSFQSCDGLEASIAVMEFRDGNSTNFFKQKRPTMVSFSPVVLKKGVFAGNTDFYDWFKGVAFDNFFGDMRTVKIALLNTDNDSKGGGTPVIEWTLEKAFVTKFTPSPLDATADTEAAIEEIEISYQSFSTGGGLLGWLF